MKLSMRYCIGKSYREFLVHLNMHAENIEKKKWIYPT